MTPKTRSRDCRPLHPLLIPGQIEDEELGRHFGALGVGTIAAYKLWCHRHGLSTELHKNATRRRDELALAERLLAPLDENAGRDHDPRVAAVIERICRGEMRHDTLTDVPSRVRKVYRALGDDSEARDSFGRLVLHVEGVGALLRPVRVFRQLPHDEGNTCISALGQLARHCRQWLRPVEDWRPDTDHQRPQFRSLAEYLLARYPMPPTMDSVWFMGDTPEARLSQEWYMHVAGGQNLRTAGIPMRITRRMAHLFGTETPSFMTLVQALRWSQMKALGGDVRLIWTVATSTLGRSLEDEDFWESVVHFFANNGAMLESSYVEPIIDYVRHQRYVPQRLPQPDGTFVEGPPPHPGYSMKGRSAPKLLRQVDEWHATLSGLEDVPLRRWDSCGLKELVLEETDPDTGKPMVWGVHELTTSAQLNVEGRLMHHCVGSYVDRCASGQFSIWSLRVAFPESEEPEERHILTIAVDSRRRAATEARGKFNLRPFDRKKLGKRVRAGQAYMALLRESGRVLRVWMDRQGLTHAVRQ